ncbi:hypothetical protein BY996DRAFT_6418537 [Phakopsora pachyrhizi]|nr:hypothetical protein BY996DRAFT_6418537 [Phakopsora pachyrhizi]
MVQMYLITTVTALAALVGSIIQVVIAVGVQRTVVVVVVPVAIIRAVAVPHTSTTLSLARSSAIEDYEGRVTKFFMGSTDAYHPLNPLRLQPSSNYALHASHAATHTEKKFGNTKMIQQLELSSDHVKD